MRQKRLSTGLETGWNEGDLHPESRMSARHKDPLKEIRLDVLAHHVPHIDSRTISTWIGRRYFHALHGLPYELLLLS